jgi:biopolymer transport protein ExbD
MPYQPKHRSPELSTSSVADIVFLLLTFFMMTTVINSDKGLPILLPEWTAWQVQVPLHERNVFKIHINSNDEVLIEGERSGLGGLQEKVREFLLNNGAKDHLSENPLKAVVSLKADRGTTHGVFIMALDQIHGAYNGIYAEKLGMSIEQYRKLDLWDPGDLIVIKKAKQGIPMNISIAEPSAMGTDQIR